MMNNQTKKYKNSNIADKIQTFSVFSLIIILLVGVGLYMSQGYYLNKQYEKDALKGFQDLNTLSNINSMIDKNDSDLKNKVFDSSKELSSEYTSIRDLLVGDVSYHTKDIDDASKFYELANNDKALFLQKGIQNRLVYLSFKK